VFGPGKGAEAQAIADDLTPLIASPTGCESVTFFGDDSDGQYGIFVLWDSQEHADAAAGMVSPKLRAHISDKVQGPP
jgi:hypothetical protein